MDTLLHLSPHAGAFGDGVEAAWPGSALRTPVHGADERIRRSQPGPVSRGPTGRQRLRDTQRDRFLRRARARGPACHTGRDHHRLASDVRRRRRATPGRPRAMRGRSHGASRGRSPTRRYALVPGATAGFGGGTGGGAGGSWRRPYRNRSAVHLPRGPKAGAGGESRSRSTPEGPSR